MACWKQLLLYTLALLVLLGVFTLYLQPDLMVTLSDFMWSCFGTGPSR